MEAIVQLETLSDIPKGAIVVQCGYHFLLQSINDGPRTIGYAARNIKKGEVVLYNPNGDTSDITLPRRSTRGRPRKETP